MISVVRAFVLVACLFVGFAYAAEGRNLSVNPGVGGGKRVALVIGNAAYGASPLRNPVNDARAIAAKLQKLGFDVVKRENLTTKQIGATLREFRSRLSPGAEALFFYAGHGLQVKGVNYLPAVDADITSEEDVPNQSINVNQLLEIMDDTKTRLNLIFLDACRNNPFSRRFRSAGGGLAKVEAPSGTKISFATRPGSVAADGAGSNGLYTEHLLRVMDEPGQPIEQALKKVYSGVKQASKGAQEPWEEGTIEGEFYFQTLQGGQVAGVQPSAAPVVRVQSPAEIEQELWDSVKNSRDQGDINVYLSSYPNGRFTALARQKLKAMTVSLVPAAAPSTLPAPVPAIASPATLPAPAPAIASTPSPAARVNIGTSRHDIQLRTPDIAENGAVVPVEVNFSPPLRAGDQVDVVVGTKRVSTLEVVDGELSAWSLRLAMTESGTVRAQSSGGGRAERSVRVTIGVDSALLAASPQVDLASSKIRTKAGETRMLLAGALSSGKLTVSGTGFRVTVSGSPSLSLNPVMGFQGSVKEGDTIQLGMMR